MSEATIFLLDSKTGKMVEATLFEDVPDEHLKLWETSWSPLMKSHRENQNSITPEDSHWNWKRKANEWRQFLQYQSYSILCEDNLQGLMLIDNTKSARILEQFGKPLVYVQFLSTAPWNRPEFNAEPRYKGVGRAFILCAVQASLNLDYKGRVGLHSLPKAEDFYEDKCGFTRLGEDASHQNLAYYEMTETQAKLFRQNKN